MVEYMLYLLSTTIKKYTVNLWGAISFNINNFNKRAVSSKNVTLLLTKLVPLTSQTYDLLFALNISKPNNTWWNTLHTLWAISFSSLFKTTGNLISFPFLSLSTLPLIIGLFLASACA